VEGIIYKTQSYLESGKLCYVYTKRGKVTLHAKGAQKMTSKDRVLTQYLTKITFEDTNKDMMTLMNAQMKDDYEDIKSSVDSVKKASVILEIIDHLVVDNMDHTWLYERLEKALNYSELLVFNQLRFALHFLHHAGYDLHLEGDGTPLKGYNIEHGRVVYEHESIQVDLTVVEMTRLLELKYTKYDTIIAVENETLTRLMSFVKMYIQYHLNYQLKG
jgi:DNA repair protein RecO (recombination protein O)